MLVGGNLLAHFGVFSLELPSELMLLRGETLSAAAAVSFTF